MCDPKSRRKQKIDDADCGTSFESVDEIHFEIENQVPAMKSPMTKPLRAMTVTAFLSDEDLLLLMTQTEPINCKLQQTKFNVSIVIYHITKTLSICIYKYSSHKMFILLRHSTLIW